MPRTHETCTAWMRSAVLSSWDIVLALLLGVQYLQCPSYILFSKHEIMIDVRCMYVNYWKTEIENLKIPNDLRPPTRFRMILSCIASFRW